MRTFCTHLQTITMMVLFAFSTVQKASASAKAGEASVNTGSTVTIALADVYRRTLMQSTGISYQWYSENDSYVTVTGSTRYEATVKGVRATSSCKVYFRCSYYIDGFYRTMDFYYDITVESTNVSVTNVSLDKSSISMKEGSTEWLTAYVYPTNATNRNVNWSSSNTSVATVSSYGQVSAKSAGTATITCRAADGSGEYATCRVSVEAATIDVSNITLDKTSVILNAGESIQLNAYISPSSATDKSVSWTSDNTSVATVSSNGLVSAKSAGVSQITASTTNNLSAVCTITVEEKKIGEPTQWSGHYKVSSSHVVNNPTRVYQDDFDMTIEEKNGVCYITSMFGDDLTLYNDGGFKLHDNGDGTATIDISYYDILRYTDNNSPLYVIYVLDETIDDWTDSWILKMNEDGSISIGEFYIVAFFWNENEEIWKNGQLEALYFDMIASTDTANGISNTDVLMPKIHIEHGTIWTDKVENIMVFKDNGMVVFSGNTNRIENLPKGLYFVRIGNRIEKILIK